MTDVQAQLSQTVSDLNARIALLSEKNDILIKTLRALGMYERSYVLANATMEQRERYHALSRHVQAATFASRAALGEDYLASMQPDPVTADFEVPQDEGLAALDAAHHPLIQAVIAEATAFYDRAVAAGRTFPTKDSLDFVGSANKDFDHGSALFKLASSPLLLAPVIRYFGVFPILTGFGVTLARNETFFRKSSQRLHFDPEDRSQLKVFVYLTDVDADSGPFMAVPAPECAHLFARPDFVLDRQDDTVVASGAIRPFHGPAGTVIFCDTCRCLHAGARPGARPRLMLSIEYNLPSHLGRKLFPKDNEPTRVRTAMLQPENPDRFMAALLDRDA